MTRKNLRIAVVYGGWSPEREVSAVSGKKMVVAARNAGYNVVAIDARKDITNQISEVEPDIILNALHGIWGEDGCAQGIFETLNIPYSHSGVLASALAMDKRKSKNVFQSIGIDVAKDIAVSRADAVKSHPLQRPYVVKPISNGSSLGVVIVGEDDPIPSDILLSDNWTFGDNLMAEEFVPGRELTVGVLGGEPLAVTEIMPSNHFYDYKAKYEIGGSEHTLPAEVSQSVAERALEVSHNAHEILGCRGVTRADFRYDESNDRLVLLEMNTQPGMTPTSLVPEQAAYRGMSFEDLVVWMIEDASCPR